MFDQVPFYVQTHLKLIYIWISNYYCFLLKLSSLQISGSFAKYLFNIKYHINWWKNKSYNICFFLVIISFIIIGN
jgi:hypothetical protein